MTMKKMINGVPINTKPRKSRQAADLERIQPFKDEYLHYFRRFPVQAAAADFIGRSVDTIQSWRKLDPEFNDAVLRAKADYVANKFNKMRPDNLLMHLYPELRPPKQEIEQSGETSVIITYVHPTDTTGTNPEAGSGLAEASGQDDN